MRGRALLTSIPKCGKNLVRSYFDALGLRRTTDDTDLAITAGYTQARWLAATRGRTDGLDAYLQQGRPAYERLLRSFASLPDGRFLHGHVAFDAELCAAARAARLPIVFLYRDPRACLASLAHFLVDWGEPADLLPRLARRDVPTALQMLLESDGTTTWLEDVYASYEGWRDAPGVLMLRYEDLVGPRGGGSEERQVATLVALARHIGWQGEPGALFAATAQAFNPRVTTFRRGTVGGWRADLTGRLDAEQWAALERLGQRWGFPAGVDAPAPSLEQAALVALVKRLEAAHAALLEQVEALASEQAAQRAEIERLQRRVAELSSRRAIRAADGLGRIVRAVCGTEWPVPEPAVRALPSPGAAPVHAWPVGAH
jgi:hypothetical protein